MESPEQLFARYRRDRDPEALGAVFDRCGPKLLALALHLCGHPADAEDALQATFVAAIDQAARWDAERPLLPWLSGILDRQCRQVHQRRQRRRERDLPAAELLLDEGSPVAASERRELVARLRQHIERLPLEQRQVLLLQLEHGLSPAEVGEVLGVAPGTVRMRLHRGVQALRAVLPASLMALMLAALPARGVAAVRAAIIGHAARTTMAGVLPKLLLAAAVLVLGIGSAYWFSAPLAPATASRQATLPSVGALVADAVHDATVAPPERQLLAAAAPTRAAATGSVRVRLRIGNSEQAVANMHVDLVRMGGDVDSRFGERVAGTDAAGEAVFDGCAPGLWRVDLAGSRGGQRVTVQAGHEALVECTLSPDRMEVGPFRCRVLLPDGRPAAGARIVATALYGRTLEFELGSADTDGHFASTVPYEWLAICARLPDFPPTNYCNPGPNDDVVLQFPPRGALVRGVVVGADAEPVRSALVRFELADDARMGPRPRIVATNDRGQFHCSDLAAVPLRAHVQAEGHAIGTFDVDCGQGGSHDVRWQLVAGRPMRGRVVDQHGQPVPAHIRVGDHLSREADAEGRFDFQNVDLRFRSLRLLAHGHRAGDFVWPADDAAEVAIPLWRWPHYPLRLSDARGQPLAGYRVRLEPLADGSRFTTDRDGRVAPWVTAEAATSLWIGAPGSLDATIRLPLPVGLVPEVECAVEVPNDAVPSAVVSGTIEHGSTTATWISVEMRSPSGQYLCRQQGELTSFRFEQVPAGDWHLHVRRSGQVVEEPPRVIAGLAADERRDLGRLSPPPTGRVLFLPQRDAKDASVHFSNARGDELGSRRPDGEPFALPVGTYQWLWMANNTDWPEGEVTVVADQTTVVEVPLRPAVRRQLVFPVPTPDWGTPNLVRYRLLAPDGQQVDAEDFDPRTELPFRRVPPLWPGEWRLELTLPDGQRFGGGFTIASGSEAGPALEIAVRR